LESNCAFTKLLFQKLQAKLQKTDFFQIIIKIQIEFISEKHVNLMIGKNNIKISNFVL